MALQQDMTYRLDGLPGGMGPAKLIVFSDDWGRHPSSCQHLVQHLLADHDVLWVNTVGTRRPSLSREDLRRAAGKVGGWLGAGEHAKSELPSGLKITSPKMWPGFRRPWQRKLNANAIIWHLHEALGRRSDEERIAITTLPITADLIGKLDVDRWVYYCVDNFAAWPGLDSDVMQAMEQDLVRKADAVVAVSQTLCDRVAGMGRQATLLTHGIDVDHWKSTNTPGEKRKRAHYGPTVLFWGLIDQRLDTAWCSALAKAMQRRGGTFILAGPQQSADPALRRLPNTHFPGTIAYNDLPVLAAQADVLVMPYIDAKVTRAMQPLKFKEYLATGKPVVVRDLPATRPWSDAADVARHAEDFVKLVLDRAQSGATPGQVQARERLTDESWAEKARQIASIWNKQPQAQARIAA